GGVDAAVGFGHRLLEGAADSHDLAGAPHAGADYGVEVAELVERPARNLHHDVVERRLEEGAGAGDIVPDLGNRLAERDAGGDLGNGIAGGLGGERGAAGESRVDLDDEVAVGI